jgi:hypothetical protein
MSFALWKIDQPANPREHIAELMKSLGCRAFAVESSRELTTFAVTLAQGIPRLERLAATVIEEARRRRISFCRAHARSICCASRCACGARRCCTGH